LLVQWSVVDGLAVISGTELPSALIMPDWQWIAGEPLAWDVILGLAGSFSETEAQNGMADLAVLSERIARMPPSLNVAGWCFPVSIDPTWPEASGMAPLVVGRPRPLWVSIYDSPNMSAEPLADWLLTWLPPDVGVLFQDGAGVLACDPATARHYADVLAERLGSSRLRITVEAFRPGAQNKFRAAIAPELAPQIGA
jgi:hypothetical protein